MPRRRSHAAPAGHPSASTLLGDLFVHLRTLRTALDRGLPFPSEGVAEVRDLLLEAEHEVERLKHSGQLTEVDAAVVVVACLGVSATVLRVATAAPRQPDTRCTSAGVN